MSPTALTWTVSVAGAAIFFGLGYAVLALRVARRRESEGPSPHADHDQRESSRALERELARARSESTGLSAELDERSHAVDGLSAERDELASRLEASKARHATMEAELQTLRAAAAAAEGAPSPRPGGSSDGELDEARRTLRQSKGEVQALQARVAEIETAVEAARSAAARHDKQRLAAQAELATVRSERNQLGRRHERTVEELESTKEQLARAEARAAAVVAAASTPQAPDGSLSRQELEGALHEAAEAAAERDRRTAELEVVRHEAAEAAAERDRRTAELEAAWQEASEVAAEGDRRAAELAAAQKELEALRIDRGQQRRHASDAEELRERLSRLDEELATSRAATQEVEDLRQQARQLQQELQAARARQEDHDSLQEEARGLREQVAEVEELRQRAEELEELRGELQQLKLAQSTAARKVEDLDAAAEDRAALTARVHDLSQHAADAETLRRTVKRLEARLFDAGLSPDDEEPAPSAPPPAEQRLDRVSEVLEAFDWTQQQRAAAVADAMGLLVAGSGDDRYLEGLAALSGPVSQLAQRAAELLPMVSPRVVRVSEGRRALLTVRLFGSDEAFALATLASESGPSEEELERCAAALSEALG